MYINDVIRLAKAGYPSEYGEEEMYVWCNEVSAMLAVEDRNVFCERYLSTDMKGTLLLPEGVDIENVSAVYHKGRMLAKEDLRARGRMLYSGVRDAIVRVVYMQPYRPIRLTRYRGEAEIDPAHSLIKTGPCEFIKGDTIIISCLHSGGAPRGQMELPVLSVEYDPENIKGYILHTAEGAIDGEARTEDCLITRIVTEKTVCDAPYDSMYVDYILAKINLYQHNSEEYNRYMTSFNSRLSAYKKWLINHMPPEPGNFKNWWWKGDR